MEYYKHTEFGDAFIIKQTDVTTWIPVNLGNTDYQNFLVYLYNNDLTIDDIPVWAP